MSTIKILVISFFSFLVWLKGSLLMVFKQVNGWVLCSIAVIVEQVPLSYQVKLSAWLVQLPNRCVSGFGDVLGLTCCSQTMIVGKSVCRCQSRHCALAAHTHHSSLRRPSIICTPSIPYILHCIHTHPLKSDGARPVHYGIACLEHFIRSFSPWSLLKSAVKYSICRPQILFLHSVWSLGPNPSSTHTSS